MSDVFAEVGSTVADVAGGPSPRLVDFSRENGRERGAGRRKQPRFKADENRLWMQWWEGGAYLGRSARLVNVSRNGAMIVSGALLTERLRLRIFLEEPAPQIGVHATVLGIVEGVQGTHQIRLGFLSPCPDAFLEAATHGFDSWLARERPNF